MITLTISEAVTIAGRLLSQIRDDVHDADYSAAQQNALADLSDAIGHYAELAMVKISEEQHDHIMTAMAIGLAIHEILPELSKVME